jgi:hypothetical protein
VANRSRGTGEVTSQDLWPIAKSFIKRDGPKAPTAVHGPVGITYTYYPNEKANTIANSLENQFTSHDLCDGNHERQVQTRVQALLPSVVDTRLRNAGSCDIHKLVIPLKLRKACGLDSIPNKCLRYLVRITLVHLRYLFNHYLRLCHFPKLCKS